MRFWLTLVSITLLLVGSVVAWDNRPFNPSNTISVYSDGGGSIDEYQNKYGKIGYEGKYLRINGICASACTYFMKLVPPDHVCATNRSKFLFHGIYSGLSGFDKEFTQLMHPIVYPEFVLKLLKDRGFDGSEDVDKEKYPIGLIELTREELKINAC